MLNVNRLATSYYSYLLIASMVIIIDQILKTLAIKYLSNIDNIMVTSWFDLILVYNKGAGFGILNSGYIWQRILLCIASLSASIFLLIWIYKDRANNFWRSVNLSLILGGAIGNFWDRIVYGKVVDFVSLHYNSFYWPAFNFADSMITLGAVFLFIDCFFCNSREYCNLQ